MVQDYPPILNGVMWAQVVLAIIFIGLRMYTRYFIIRKVGWDDIVMILNLVRVLPFPLSHSYLSSRFFKYTSCLPSSRPDNKMCSSHSSATSYALASVSPTESERKWPKFLARPTPRPLCGKPSDKGSASWASPPPKDPLQFSSFESSSRNGILPFYGPVSRVLRSFARLLRLCYSSSADQQRLFGIGRLRVGSCWLNFTTVGISMGCK